MEALSSTNQVQRQWHAAYLTMRMIEWVVDERNPGVNPPLSQRLRDASRSIHGDNLDGYTPKPAIFDFLTADITGNNPTGSAPSGEAA